jgi:hypothetical protein
LILAGLSDEAHGRGGADVVRGEGEILGNDEGNSVGWFTVKSLGLGVGFLVGDFVHSPRFVMEYGICSTESLDAPINSKWKQDIACSSEVWPWNENKRLQSSSLNGELRSLFHVRILLSDKPEESNFVRVKHLELVLYFIQTNYMFLLMFLFLPSRSTTSVHISR